LDQKSIIDSNYNPYIGDSPILKFDECILSEKIQKLKIFDQVSEKYGITLRELDPWFEI
jgi:hypothetical protein